MNLMVTDLAISPIGLACIALTSKIVITLAYTHISLCDADGGSGSGDGGGDGGGCKYKQGWSYLMM